MIIRPPYRKVQLLDFSEDQMSCPYLERHASDYTVNNPYGTFINGQAMLCGGTGQFYRGEPYYDYVYKTTKECYTYHREVNFQVFDDYIFKPKLILIINVSLRAMHGQKCLRAV